jgi:choline dehydrogenase-like flavoprotein
MLHEIGAGLGDKRAGRAKRAHATMTAHERALLLAVAQAAMPGGRTFAGAGPRAIERVDNFLALAPPSFARAYRAMLLALDAAAYVSHRASLANLPAATVLGILEHWRQGDVARRTVVRMLTAPLKIAHYNDPQMYQSVGCKFGSLRVAQAEKPRFMQERVLGPEAVSAREELECDVVVVGTGAGGAVVARELAERGLAVVMIEEGEFHGREAFTGHAVEMQRKLYRDMGATVAVGNAVIPIPVGRAVGGTTVINSGTCYRTPERVLKKWQDLGLDELSPERLAPYFARVEGVLGVAPAAKQHLGGVARVIARGCDALGYSHQPLQRNAPECDGQGVCCFGCPTDAKRSTNVSYVPLALKAGATLFAGFKVERILRDGERAAGVEGRGRAPDGSERKITVRARAVVISAGTLMTPLLLEDNGMGTSSGQLGRNLSIHPAMAAMALFDEKIDGANAIPQGYAIEHFHDEGMLFEGAFAALDIAAASFTIIGPRLVELLEKYDHLACFGVMIEDHSRGRVRRGPGGRPLITYRIDDHDTARLKRAAEILARVYFAAGARSVFPMVHGFDELRGEDDLARFRNARLKARDFDLSAYHPLGTARMGRDARSSVVGQDHQVHDTPGLYVADGSVVPTSPAVNPQVTIMALATRAADKIAQAVGS